jgi:hypothetical protein
MSLLRVKKRLGPCLTISDQGGGWEFLDEKVWVVGGEPRFIGERPHPIQLVFT